MKRTIKIILLFYFLFANIMAFAQIGGPGDDDTNGVNGLEGGDPQTVPLNDKLWILIAIALMYAYYKFKKDVSDKVNIK